MRYPNFNFGGVGGGGTGAYFVPGTGSYSSTGTSGYGGGGPFGTKVAPIPMPNPAADLAARFPNLDATNANLSSDINAQLGGRLSPGTLAAMQDYEAQFANGSGMPGSNAIPGTLGYNRGVRDLGLTAEGQVKAGEAAYNSTIPTISRTQTVDPNLQSTINETNAVNASAPDPAAAASYAEKLFNKYMMMLRGPGGGSGGGFGHPGGGTGNFASVSAAPNLSAPANPSFDSGPWSKGYQNLGAFRPSSDSTIGFGGGGWSDYSNPNAASTGTAGYEVGGTRLGPGRYNPANAGNSWDDPLSWAPPGNPQSHTPYDPFGLDNIDSFDWNAALDELGI